jgi:WD40 repeat protein
MGIAIEPKTGYVYSCGSDKKIRVSEVNYQESIAECTIGNHGYTNLVYDRKNIRLFITNEVGVVFIYTTTTVKS